VFKCNGSKCAYITDTGFATPAVRQAAEDADTIILEANHDVEMLKNGIYPPHLKQRILSTRGHLSNESAGWLLANQTKDAAGNYSNEMKMEYRTDYADGGANTVERMGDHEDSPYFYDVDFCNATSKDGLYILPNFKTIQQTSWWSCGVSSTEMVLDYF
jgi:hypothetical protein